MSEENLLKEVEWKHWATVLTGTGGGTRRWSKDGTKTEANPLKACWDPVPGSVVSGWFPLMLTGGKDV